jgi:hypothetical protein
VFHCKHEGALPIIATRSNAIKIVHCPKLYRRQFKLKLPCRIKDWLRIATGYDNSPKLPFRRCLAGALHSIEL